MKNQISTFLSSIAIVLAIVAICNIAPRQTPLDWDYQGWIVGVLSLLVTALLGWQVFSVLTVEKRLKKLSDLYDDICAKSEDLEKKISDNTYYMEANIKFAETQQFAELDSHKGDLTIDASADNYLRYLECLKLFLQAENSKYPALCLINCDQVLSELSKFINSGETLDLRFDAFCDELYKQIVEHISVLDSGDIEFLYDVRARRKSLRTDHHLPPATNPWGIRTSPYRVTK